MLLTRKTQVHSRLGAKPMQADCTLASVHSILEFETGIVGVPDRRTGFLLNIVTIDEAVRAIAHPIIARASLDDESIFATVRRAAVAIAQKLELDARVRVAYFACDLNPHTRVTYKRADPALSTLTPPAMPQPTFEITASYEFAASHRLHCPGLSDDENRRIFGKCNNPNGHGHNYRIEVHCTVASEDQTAFAALDAAVENEIMRRFDHRHLNLDCPEFAALNPSVENIAMVCFGYLKQALGNAGLTARCVRVYETHKTSAIYPSGHELDHSPQAKPAL